MHSFEQQVLPVVRAPISRYVSVRSKAITALPARTLTPRHMFADNDEKSN
jgi:hypothetical protein